MKQWRIEMAERLGVKPITVAGMMRRGALPRPKVERINARVVFVINPWRECRNAAVSPFNPRHNTNEYHTNE